MRTTSSVGNNVGAVNDSQLIYAPKTKGAHGERNIQQNSESLTSITQKQGTIGMTQTQNLPKVPTGQLSTAATSFGNNPETGTIAPSNTPIPEEFTNDALQSLKQNNREMEEYIQIDEPSFVHHPEAVKATNDIIISVLTKIKEKGFSADNIEEAIENAGAKDYEKLNHPQNDQVKDPSTAEAQAHKNGGPVLEKYDKHFHGGAYGEKADQDLNTIYKRKPNGWDCLPGALRGNIPTKTQRLENIGLPKEFSDNKPNQLPPETKEIKKALDKNMHLLKEMNSLKKVDTKDWKIYQQYKGNFIEVSKNVYFRNDEESFKQELEETIKSQKERICNLLNIPFEFGVDYTDQLIREYNTFSGNITIKKLEPGTVLVRDFGQDQSVKSSCWCLAADLNSAVNCDKDLQTHLAVKPSWNGGGNRAVFVVPKELPMIYVAVGKIAQQRNDSDYEETVYHPGGGIQYNILTPNDCDVNNVEDTSGGFANAGKAFDKCCFVITDTGIIEANDRKTVQANQDQIKQPNPVATNGNKLQQND